jgi:ABC-type dipeptide/oligopeptide/nickel transport system ATPase component
MTVREALTFFSTSPKVLRRLQVLDEIGLGYLRLGQPATTLSGGEAQRIKIAAHLSTQTGDRVLYILDEPTTGLHFDDIAKLLAAFRRRDSISTISPSCWRPSENCCRPATACSSSSTISTSSRPRTGSSTSVPKAATRGAIS